MPNPFGQVDLPEWVNMGGQSSQAPNVSPLVDVLKKRMGHGQAGPFQPQPDASYSDLLGGSIAKPKTCMKPESL